LVVNATLSPTFIATNPELWFVITVNRNSARTCVPWRNPLLPQLEKRINRLVGSRISTQFVQTEEATRCRLKFVRVFAGNDTPTVNWVSVTLETNVAGTKPDCPVRNAPLPRDASYGDAHKPTHGMPNEIT
jgi:hypothetical protein